MQQTILQSFLSDQQLMGSNILSIPIPKKTHGRPSQSLTSFELKEAVSYYSASPAEKQRLIIKYGKRKLKHGISICKLDIGRWGIINRTVCPKHGREALIYNWDNKEGARVRCKECEFNTHFMPFMFNLERSKESNYNPE